MTVLKNAGQRSELCSRKSHKLRLGHSGVWFQERKGIERMIKRKREIRKELHFRSKEIEIVRGSQPEVHCCEQIRQIRPGKTLLTLYFGVHS